MDIFEEIYALKERFEQIRPHDRIIIQVEIGVRAAPPPHPQDHSKSTISIIEQAMRIYAENPQMSVAEIAERVGVDKSTLYRSEQFTRFRRMSAGIMPRRGSKDEGVIESEDR